MKLDTQLLQSLPKVLLHEHLDGVLRPQTVIDLAKDAKYTGLPTNDPDALSQWFFRGANQGSLAKYLEGFAHTIAVMQTEEALQRVAYEQAEDLSRDGVVYFDSFCSGLSYAERIDPSADRLGGFERIGTGTKGFRDRFRFNHLRDAQYEYLVGDG